MEKLGAYSKEKPYTYLFGPFPVMEMLDKKPEALLKILIHPQFRDWDKIVDRARSAGVAWEEGSDKLFRRLSKKGNTYVMAVVDKFEAPLSQANHILLVEPQDCGNLGTMIRTMAGFEYYDLALIGKGCDLFDPRTLRATMGAIGTLHHQHYNTIEDYCAAHPNHSLYPFMLGAKGISPERATVTSPFSLVFGNEGQGLAPRYEMLGQVITIPQSSAVDSLNITVACAVGMYEFWKKTKIATI